MTFRQISECLPAWLSAQIDKGTGADEGPGQVLWRSVSTESGEAAPVTTQPAEAASLGNAKGRPVHHKAPPQRRTGQPLTLSGDRRREGTTSAAYRVKPTVNGPREFRVIEGGGGRRQEGEASAAFRTRAGGGCRGCKLKLVGG